MSGIYIHIPFCAKRCNYCDFYLITNFNVLDKFLTNLKKEISIYSELFIAKSFDTIFFGGGTPSVLSASQIQDIIEHIYKNFKVESHPEISLEANPEDFILKDLIDYRSAGINRLSLGVQSFLDKELNFLTRSHTAKQAEDVVRNAVKYFNNVNVDIIYSLPSQKVEDINYSLSKSIELDVKHISAYTLTYEIKTPLYKLLERNIVKKNEEDIEAVFYNYVSDKLISNGFVHYEVSNFAKEKFYCKHNLKYWDYEEYIGFGPSSHSMINFERWNNYRDIIKYNSFLEKNILPVENRYMLTDEQMKLEFIMLSLRSTGVVLEKYKKIFKKEFEAEYLNSINELVKNNFAIKAAGLIRLSEKGYTVADEIIAKYF